ncbi:MAG: tetratricopeptide repeat protein [Gelidibacter sp.]
MKQKIYITLFLLGILIIPQMAIAQVDFNKRPTDDLGDVEDKFQENFFEALKQNGIENYQRAVDALLKCEKLDNSKTIVYYELGKNYIALKNYGAAEDVLKKAVSKEPENEWYLDELYEVYNLQGDTDKAIKTVKQLVKYHPDYRQDLAELFIKAKEYKDALKILDQLDKEFGINPDRDILRNQIYNITGRDDDRIENLEERVKANPDNEEIYLRLIYRYSETGDTKKAFEAAKNLLKVHPESKLVHLALYKFYLDNNQIGPAIESMKITLTAPEINPEAKAKVFNDFVNFVSKHPEYEKDLIEMTSLVGTEKSTKTLTELGHYYLKLDDKPKALQNFEEALQQDPNNFTIIKDVLLLQLDLNMDEKAANKSQEALDLFPAQPILYLLNGVANNKLNQPKKAIEKLEAGLDYIIDDLKMESDFYTQLSVAYKLDNNIPKSQAFAKRAETITKQQQ